MTLLSATDLADRDALRARQGKGARFDAPNAPAQDLLLARRGAAYFARKLNDLSDTELAAASRVSGWTRRHLIADVSYHARAMALALKAVRETLTPEEARWKPDIELAATLPARALRHLYAHSVVHLNVAFRDVVDEDWHKTISGPAGRPVALQNLPFLRAQKVWFGAMNLAKDTRKSDLPERLFDT